jgi:glycosyltransferase involved in cell wall biosynthesis
MAGILLAKMFSKPIQVQIHTDLQSPYFKSTSFLNRIRVLMAHFIIPRANGIRTVSEKIKLSLEDSFRLKAPVNVLPVFIDPSQFTHSKEHHEFLHEKYPAFELFALVVSRLESEKNVEFAIDAFKLISDIYPKLALVIVGNGSEEYFLKQKANALGIGDKVKFEGWVNDPSVYFQSANLFLNTSYYEGYGMTLVEARIAGLVIITTNVGVAGELASEGVGICNVGDLNAFRLHMENFLSQPDLRLRVHFNAPSPEQFLISKDEYIRRYISLWEGSVKGGW